MDRRSFQGSVTGVWGTPLRLKLDLTGAGFDAEAQGTADPFAAIDPRAIKANMSLKAHGLNLAPLFDLKPSDKLAQDIGLSSRDVVRRRQADLRRYRRCHGGIAAARPRSR